MGSWEDCEVLVKLYAWMDLCTLCEFALDYPRRALSNF